MTSNHLLALIAAAAALASGAASAGHDREKSDRHDHRATPVPQAVPNASLPDQASHGWQYFTDSRAAYAVVISPAGEYFVSRGDGPMQVTGPAGQALGARSKAD